MCIITLDPKPQTWENRYLQRPNIVIENPPEESCFLSAQRLAASVVALPPRLRCFPSTKRSNALLGIARCPPARSTRASCLAAWQGKIDVYIYIYTYVYIHIYTYYMYIYIYI